MGMGLLYTTWILDEVPPMEERQQFKGDLHGLFV